VLQGSSIDSNGAGTLLATRQCLENKNRNSESGAAGIEQVLRDALGITNIIWLPGGIEGDVTDCHVDNVTRFVRRDAIAAVRAAEDHPDYAMLEANWKVLQQARDEKCQKFELLELPTPKPLHYEFPADRFGKAKMFMQSVAGPWCVFAASETWIMNYDFCRVGHQVVLWMAVVLTALSGIPALWRAGSLLRGPDNGNTNARAPH
jgi:agmatine/peptidylarginine deiminase